MGENTRIIFINHETIFLVSDSNKKIPNCWINLGIRKSDGSKTYLFNGTDRMNGITSFYLKVKWNA